VFKGYYRNAPVAVKRILDDFLQNDKAKEDFQTECKLMLNLPPHPNVTDPLFTPMTQLCRYSPVLVFASIQTNRFVL
jgi:hypothetical protein